MAMQHVCMHIHNTWCACLWTYWLWCWRLCAWPLCSTLEIIFMKRALYNDELTHTHIIHVMSEYHYRLLRLHVHDSPLTTVLILLGTRSNQGTITPSAVTYMYIQCTCTCTCMCTKEGEDYYTCSCYGDVNCTCVCMGKLERNQYMHDKLHMIVQA